MSVHTGCTTGLAWRKTFLTSAGCRTASCPRLDVAPGISYTSYVKVIAAPLGGGVSITLIEDIDGFRFENWTTSEGVYGRAELPAPRNAMTLRFRTEVEALDYFARLRPESGQ